MPVRIQDWPEVDEALWRYAKLKWKVFDVHYPRDLDEYSSACSCAAGAECGNIGKHPRRKGYQDLASDDYLGKIRPAFFNYLVDGLPLIEPRPYNVGLLTGPASDVWVLDIDNKEATGGANGAACIEKLEAIHGPLPVTAKAFSGSRRPGAAHYFFKYDSRIRSDIGGFAPGVDVLAGGKRLVILAPSHHVSGNTYAWAPGLEPWVVGVAAAPEWLIAEIMASQARTASLYSVKPGAGARAGGATPVDPEFAAAALAYNQANTPADWPVGKRGRCPVCGSPDGFKLLYAGSEGSSPWWDCKSTRHDVTGGGRKNNGDGWGGAVLDIDAFLAKKKKGVLLRESGYL